MTALARQHQKIFAINATQSQVTAFRTTENDEQTFSKQPDVIQTERFTSGWLNEDNTGNMSPFVEDMNGVLLTLSYNTAYLLEKGIPEYSESQTYYINSFCQYLGHLYRCKVDNTINYLPTNTEKWEYIHTEAYSTASVGTGQSLIATPSGSTFNFKSLVAGTNVTLTPSPEGDAITISASMSGYADFTANSPLSYNGSTGVLTLAQANGSTDGYLTSSDWTSFNGKLSSTIFSANNSWTGTNTFSAITLGQDDLATTLGGKQDTIDANNKLSSAYLTFGSDIIPTTNNTYNLGSANYNWANAYTQNVKYGNSGINFINYIEGASRKYSQIKYMPVTGTQGTFDTSRHTFYIDENLIALDISSSGLGSSISIRAQGSIHPYSDNSYTLGGTYNWANVFTKKLTLNGTEYSSIPAAANNGSYAIQINGATKGTVYANGTGTNTINLGTYLTSHQSLAGYATLSGNNTWTGSNTFNGTVNFGGDVKRSSGDLVIQATNGEARLTGTSAVRLRSAAASEGNAGTNLKRYANVTAGKAGNENPIVTYSGSDIRMKQDISEVYLNGLDCINRIHLVNFRYKNEDNKHYKHLGVIAQEVENEIPDIKDVVLHGDDDEKDMLYVEYGMFSPYLIKAVQELSAKVDVLEQQLMER